MKIRKFEDNRGGGAAEILHFILEAFQQGEGVAVEAGDLDIPGYTHLFNPVNDGEYAGCYLFRNVKERSRICPFSERIIALFAIFLFLPLFSLIFLAVMILQGLPVIFRQLRYGLDNKDFYIYKFRTMVLTGENLHGRMVKRWGEEGRLFKMDKDPRVTWLGSLLRRCYLDELPQLFNVVKGDMRLCGPRPLPTSDNYHYTEKYHTLRLQGMPGITGIWQIGKHRNISFDEMCLLDVYYLCNNSFLTDLKILAKTVKLLFSRHS